MLFISRDTCSDSIAKMVRAWFYGVSHNYPHDMLQNGVSHRCACAKLSAKGGGGGIAPFLRSAGFPEKASCDMGYRSDSIAISWATKRGLARASLYASAWDLQWFQSHISDVVCAHRTGYDQTMISMALTQWTVPC